ncbi:glycosyltransferase family 2 protein [Candidatus Pacebacteria bacterium]|nr:glycosyltransferase family 2 protein [Candidatus Paceibacterota bacterium]
MKEKEPEITVIFPCLNEEEALVSCLQQIRAVITKNKLAAEVLVTDNGSTDRSVEIIKEQQKIFPELKLFIEPNRGYGSAYQKGLSKARGKYIIMSDIDKTYDLKESWKFVDALREGSEFVIGNRFSGKMHKNSMPLLHKYLGNPILSFLVRLFFGTKVRDVHCGMRAISKSALNKINLKTTGMEFASEMVIKAVKEKLKITEVPISYSPRLGESKLRSMTDGWRHLRFILLYSPLFIFFIPGIFLFGIGLFSMAILYFGKLEFFGQQFIIHPIFISSIFMIIGFQLISFAGFAKAYAVTHLEEESHFLEKIMKYMSIEKASIIGIAGIIIGIFIYIVILTKWIDSGFGSLNEIKNSVIALTVIVLGVQTISNSFMTSILGIKEK